MNLQSEIQQNHIEWSQSLGKLWLSVVRLNKEKELLHYNSSSEWVQPSTSAVEYEKGANARSGKGAILVAVGAQVVKNLEWGLVATG